VKRRGNRRYYQHVDVVTIRHIRTLLYEQGYTIGGARQRMQEDADGLLVPSELKRVLQETIAELEGLLQEMGGKDTNGSLRRH